LKINLFYSKITFTEECDSREIVERKVIVVFQVFLECLEIRVSKALWAHLVNQAGQAYR